MTGKLKPYPQYKDSGIDWLGDVPEHWKIIKLKIIALLNMGQSPDSASYNSDGVGTPFLQGNAEFKELYPNEKYYTLEPKKIACKDNVLFSIRAPVGAVNIANKNYAIGRGLCAIDINKCINDLYFLYWIRCFKKQFEAIQTGSTFEAISAEQLANMLGVMPLPKEQTTIANYLV